MSRARGSVAKHQRRKKVLKLARGYYGRRSKTFKVAKESVVRSWAHSFIGRKLRKRDFRRLWITRINAAAREHGLSYSKFMHKLKDANILINRKILADLAVNDKKGFKEIVEKVK